MNQRWQRLGMAGLMLALAAAGPASRPYVNKGGLTFATKLLELHDDKRNLDVPVKVYYPTEGKNCPVVLFSHGLGGSREGYKYIGQALASHGYVAIHLTHVGSDTSIFFNAKNPLEELPRAAADPKNILNRPADISFVIDQLKRLNEADADLKGRLDPTRVGVAGHSFGAYTVLAAVGEVFATPTGEKSFIDRRIKAAVAMSAPTPHDPAAADLDHLYAGIKVPVFHMTGTLDDLPIGGSKAIDRRIPFDHTTSADAYLLTLNGGDHMTFSGHRRSRGSVTPAQLLAIPGNSGDPATDAVFHPLITEGMVAFFDAYLKGDQEGKRWLKEDFANALGDHGTFEQKVKRASVK